MLAEGELVELGGELVELVELGLLEDGCDGLPGEDGVDGDDVDGGDGGVGIVGLLWLGQPVISPSDKSIKINLKYIEGLPEKPGADQLNV